MKLFRAISIIVFITFIAIGCGSSGGGDSSGNNNDNSSNTATDLKISHTRAVPGTFITIEDSSIESDSGLDIKFSNSSGFDVVLKSSLTEKGRAKIPVPPYINNETGNFEAGNVTISITNGKQAAFQIEALPELAGFEAGSVLKSYLQAIVDNLNEALVYLDDFEVKYDHDVEGLKTQIQIQIDDMKSTLNELNTLGTCEVTSLISGTSTLTEADLRIVEQLLYAMITGIYDEIQSESSPAMIAASSLNLPPKWRQGLIAGVEKSSKQARGGMSALLGGLKDKVDNYGGETPVKDLYSKGLGMLEGVVDFVAKGITNEAVNKLQDEFGDSYQPGQGFKDAGMEELEELKKAWTPEWMVRVGTILGKIYDARKAQIKKKCDEETLTDELRNDCLEWEVHPEVFSTINWAKFIPVKAITEKPVTLDYYIGGMAGSKHAEINTVTINWGDGNEISTFVFNSGYPDVSAFAGKSAQHTYTLPSVSDREYTAKITVTGDNDPDKSHVHSLEVIIRVTAAKDPLSVSFLNGNNLLDINEPGSWNVEVSGGVPPYDVEMQWGDGKTISRDNSYLEGYKARHFYTKAQKYTIIFLVYDARYFSKSAEFIVDVSDPDAGQTTWGSHLYDAEWYDADEYCKSGTVVERLPTIAELQAAYNECLTTQGLSQGAKCAPDGFFDANYWSSESDGDEYAKVFNFMYGIVYSELKDWQYDNYTRCVK